jgi:hypothetical protein
MLGMQEDLYRAATEMRRVMLDALVATPWSPAEKPAVATLMRALADDASSAPSSHLRGQYPIQQPLNAMTRAVDVVCSLAEHARRLNTERVRTTRKGSSRLLSPHEQVSCQLESTERSNAAGDPDLVGSEQWAASSPAPLAAAKLRQEELEVKLAAQGVALHASRQRQEALEQELAVQGQALQAARQRQESLEQELAVQGQALMAAQSSLHAAQCGCAALTVAAAPLDKVVGERAESGGMVDAGSGGTCSKRIFKHRAALDEEAPSLCPNGGEVQLIGGSAATGHLHDGHVDTTDSSALARAALDRFSVPRAEAGGGREPLPQGDATMLVMTGTRLQALEASLARSTSELDHALARVRALEAACGDQAPTAGSSGHRGSEDDSACVAKLKDECKKRAAEREVANEEAVAAERALSAARLQHAAEMQRVEGEKETMEAELAGRLAELQMLRGRVNGLEAAAETARLHAKQVVANRGLEGPGAQRQVVPGSQHELGSVGSRVDSAQGRCSDGAHPLRGAMDRSGRSVSEGSSTQRSGSPLEATLSHPRSPHRLSEPPRAGDSSRDPPQLLDLGSMLCAARTASNPPEATAPPAASSFTEGDAPPPREEPQRLAELPNTANTEFTFRDAAATPSPRSEPWDLPVPPPFAAIDVAAYHGLEHAEDASMELQAQLGAATEESGGLGGEHATAFVHVASLELSSSPVAARDGNAAAARNVTWDTQSLASVGGLSDAGAVLAAIEADSAAFQGQVTQHEQFSAAVRARLRSVARSMRRRLQAAGARVKEARAMAVASLTAAAAADARADVLAAQLSAAGLVPAAPTDGEVKEAAVEARIAHVQRITDDLAAAQAALVAANERLAEKEGELRLARKVATGGITPPSRGRLSAEGARAMRSELARVSAQVGWERAHVRDNATHTNLSVSLDSQHSPNRPFFPWPEAHDQVNMMSPPPRATTAELALMSLPLAPRIGTPSPGPAEASAWSLHSGPDR